MCTYAIDVNGNQVGCSDPNANWCYTDATMSTAVACGAEVSNSIAISGSAVTGSTVSPNPAIPNTSQGSSASALSSLGSTLGQWGATIAGIATGTPTVVTAAGARTGAAVSPVSALGAGGSGTILLLLAAVVVVILVMGKK